MSERQQEHETDAPLDFTVHFRMNRQTWEKWGAFLGERGARSRRLAAFVEREVARAERTARGPLDG